MRLYFDGERDGFHFIDLLQTEKLLTKPVVFGFILTSVGCFMGLRTKGGTQGVGEATTRSVVVASVLILSSDFFMTKILLALFPVV